MGKQIESANRKIEELEEELREAHDRIEEKNRLLELQRDEFEALNAEIQTTNEELKATNEELLALNEELQKNEAALSKSEANTKALINNTLQFFYLLDTNHKIMAFNQIVREHFVQQLNVEIRVGDDFLDYIDPSEHEIFFDEFKRALNGELISGQRRVKVIQGPYIWLRYNYTPIHGFGDRIEQVSISTLDVTEEVEAKNELIENQLLISSIFKTADVGLCLIDENGYNVKVNPEYCAIYGVTEDELIGKHFSVVYPNILFKTVQGAFRSFIESGRESEYIERTFTRRADGLKRAVSISSQKMTTPDGRRFSVVTVRDMTDIRKTQQLLEETQDEFKTGGWEYDMRDGSTNCTSQVYKIYDVPRDFSWSFDNISPFYMASDMPRILTLMDRCIKKFEYIEFETQIKSFTDKKKWVKVSSRPVVVNNQTIKVFGTVQDITEVKKAEKKLKETQKRFENLFQYASDAIFLIDPKSHQIIDCNQVATTYLGYSKEELKGKKITKISAEKQISKELIKRAIKKGKLIFETEHQTKAGEIIPVEVSSRVVDTDGQLMLQSFVRDISKRKQAEIEIRKSEERFRKIFNESPIGMSVVQINGKYLTVNDQLCAILGFDREELLTRSFQDITHPDDLALDEVLSQKVFEGEIPFLQLEKRYIHKKNKPVWTRVTATIIRDDQGEPLYGLSMVEDISKRKEAEQRLKETEQRFQKVFDQSPIGIVLVNEKGEYLDANRQMSRITGYTREELIKRDFDSVTHKDDLSEDKRLTKKIFKGEIPSFQMEKRYIRKDGELIWAKVTGTVIRDDNGIATYGVGMIEDITQTKEAEEKLRQSEERFEKMAEVSPVGIFSTDSEGNHTYANERYLQLSDLTPEEAHGRNWLNSVHPEDRDRILEEWARSDAEGRSFKLEYRFKNRNKKITWVLAQATAVHDKQDKIIGYIGSITDITERKMAEAKLKKSNLELKKTNSELDRFVYSASHDLRAPLVSILGLVNIAMHEESDPKKKELLGMMRKSVHKLDDFIQDIIYYSRNARLAIKREEIELTALVEDCLDSYKFIEGAESVERIVEIKEGFKTYSDSGRLKIILNNLISNAIRFRRNIPDSFVKVKMNLSKEKFLIIRVEDNGIGISPKHIEKVFDMFYRAKEDKVGSGLGLYIVKETVEKLKGKIDVSSELGKGTKFKIIIPVRKK
jgi:PAS domain S-box-containing protein